MATTRPGRVRVLAWATAATLGFAACVTPAARATTPAPSPPSSQQVSLSLGGDYGYAVSGRAPAGSFAVTTGLFGSVQSVRGEAVVPGARAGWARIRVDLVSLAWFPVAFGHVTVLDPASGVDVRTPVVFGEIRPHSPGGAGGSMNWMRIWAFVALHPYALQWEITDSASPPDVVDPCAVALPGSPGPDLDACAPVAAEGDFDALTYNVAGLPEGISSSHPATHSPLIGPLLNGYDVVLLQEDFEFYQDLVAAGSDHPYVSVPGTPPQLRDPTRPTAWANDGLEGLSRLPFSHVTRVRWDVCAGVLDGASDCLANKGFAVATVHLANGVTVDVYDLHADAGGGPPDVAARQSNMDQLAAYVGAHSGGHAVVLGGDTNLDDGPDDAPVWQSLLDATGLVDVCDVLDCGADAGRVDRFAFRNSATLTLEPLTRTVPATTFQTPGGEPLSDHDPVAVRFHWSAA